MIVSKEELISNIYEYGKSLPPQGSWGLIGGYAGTILYSYQLYRLTSSEIYLYDVHEKIQLVLQNINLIKSAIFSNGYSGICWMLRYLAEQGVLENSNIDESLEELDNYSLLNLKYLSAIGNFDFLHGSLGIAYYFARFHSSLTHEALEYFIESLDQKKIVVGDNEFAWLYDTYSNGQRIGNVYNLGMAHGMASLVYFLSFCIEKEIRISKCLELLNGLINFYLRNQNHNQNGSSFFSYWIDPSKKEIQDSRLAWCYGDMGISIALLKAGKILKRQDVTSFALKIANHCADRSLSEKNTVKEANICHGTAGLLYMFFQIYNYTHDNKYKEVAEIWYRETIKRSHHQGPYAGFELPDAFVSKENSSIAVSLLDGISGIGIALLSQSFDSNNCLDCLMMTI